jgi:hypothetical protein
LTIDKVHVSNINPYVGFLVRECSMSTFSLAEACNAELFADFINWHMSQDADGGYGLLKQTAEVLATISQYLVAKHEMPEVIDGKRPWDIFYDMSREVMKLGASSTYITAAPDVRSWKPSDLHQIGEQGWTYAPVKDKMTSPGVHATTVFNCKRTAVFYYLAFETPLRARNWLEMKWHKNLVRIPEGLWKVRFVGDELKVGRRGYITNVKEHVYSEAASRRIDQWRGVLEAHFGEVSRPSPRTFFLLPTRTGTLRDPTELRRICARH